jgi:hypothetical protein
MTRGTKLRSRWNTWRLSSSGVRDLSRIMMASEDGAVSISKPSDSNTDFGMRVDGLLDLDTKAAAAKLSKPSDCNTDFGMRVDGLFDLDTEAAAAKLDPITSDSPHEVTWLAFQQPLSRARTTSMWPASLAAINGDRPCFCLHTVAQHVKSKLLTMVSRSDGSAQADSWKQRTLSSIQRLSISHPPQQAVSASARTSGWRASMPASTRARTILTWHALLASCKGSRPSFCEPHRQKTLQQGQARRFVISTHVGQHTGTHVASAPTSATDSYVTSHRRCWLMHE